MVVPCYASPPPTPPTMMMMVSGGGQGQGQGGGQGGIPPPYYSTYPVLAPHDGAPAAHSSSYSSSGAVLVWNHSLPPPSNLPSLMMSGAPVSGCWVCPSPSSPPTQGPLYQVPNQSPPVVVAAAASSSSHGIPPPTMATMMMVPPPQQPHACWATSVPPGGNPPAPGAAMLPPHDEAGQPHVGWGWGSYCPSGVATSTAPSFSSGGCGAFSSSSSSSSSLFLAGDATTTTTPAFYVTRAHDGTIATATPVRVVQRSAMPEAAMMVPAAAAAAMPEAMMAAMPEAMMAAMPASAMMVPWDSSAPQVGFAAFGEPSTPTRPRDLRLPPAHQEPHHLVVVTPASDRGRGAKATPIVAATVTATALPPPPPSVPAAQRVDPMDLLANVATAVDRVGRSSSSTSSSSTTCSEASSRDSPVLKPRAETPPPPPPEEELGSRRGAPRLVPPSPPLTPRDDVAFTAGAPVAVPFQWPRPLGRERDAPRRISVGHSVATAMSETGHDHEEQPGLTFLEPTILDVVVSKQAKVSGQYVGNDFYNKVIHLNAIRYERCHSNHEKSFVARTVVDGFAKHGTRFLKRRSSRFVELSRKAACRHVKKSLARALEHMESMREQERQRATQNLKAAPSSGSDHKDPPRPRLDNPVPFGEWAQPSFEARTPEQSGPRPYQPHPNDVVFGRGNNIANHPGNLLFRRFVLKARDAYGVAARHDKSKIAETIVNQVLGLSPPGRFLAMGPDGRYYDVERHRVFEKTCQACRERKWSPASAGRSTSGPPPPAASSSAVGGVGSPPEWW